MQEIVSLSSSSINQSKKYATPNIEFMRQLNKEKRQRIRDMKRKLTNNYKNKNIIKEFYYPMNNNNIIRKVDKKIKEIMIEKPNIKIINYHKYPNYIYIINKRDTNKLFTMNERIETIENKKRKSKKKRYYKINSLNDYIIDRETIIDNDIHRKNVIDMLDNNKNNKNNNNIIETQLIRNLHKRISDNNKEKVKNIGDHLDRQEKQLREMKQEVEDKMKDKNKDRKNIINKDFMDVASPMTLLNEKVEQLQF